MMTCNEHKTSRTEAYVRPQGYSNMRAGLDFLQ